MQDKLPLWRRIIKGVFMALLTVVLLAAFYIAVVMGNPKEEDASISTTKQDQPLLSSMSSSLLIRSVNQLGELRQHFPAPIMKAANSNSMVFEQGLCQAVPFDGGFGRKVTLTYRTAQGTAVTITSIYPARAVSLIEKDDYTISSSTTGPTLGGLRSVRMENTDSVRLHAQSADALYVVTLPKLPDASLRSLTSLLQLYQGE